MGAANIYGRLSRTAGGRLSSVGAQVLREQSGELSHGGDTEVPLVKFPVGAVKQAVFEDSGCH